MEAKEQRIVGLVVKDLNEAIDGHIAEGFRLDMIRPADDPIEAWVSNEDFVFHIHKRLKPHRFKGVTSHAAPPVVKTEWHAGRAGMMYRDVLPNRMDGKVAVSHIRLAEGGAVDDYVHYHKVEFQVIYCLKGRIKVVYEDQGEAFWLEPGDLVVQPPEIRHRVLECEANSEVIEITMPAEHETWVEHEMELPTSEVKPDRIFGTQRFVRKIGPKNGNAETNFEENMVELAEKLPIDESIKVSIHHIVPAIHRYLAELSPAIGG